MPDPNGIEALEKQLELRHIQYLNVLEWFVFLVNNKEITDNAVIEYYRPMFMEDYKTILMRYEHLYKDPALYSEMKSLHAKWVKEATDT